jgi:hypothetical protein
MTKAPTLVPTDNSLPPVFPQDVIDSILNQLRDDFTTVKSSALVCSKFALSCRRTLFYKDFLNVNTFKKFSQLVLNSYSAFLKLSHLFGNCTSWEVTTSTVDLNYLLFSVDLRTYRNLGLRASPNYTYSGWK